MAKNRRAWNQIFKVICKESIEIHCIVAKKKELTLYGITDNNRCFYCSDPDAVLLTFHHCSTTSFHNSVLNWFNEMHKNSISPTTYELLFGIEDGKDNNTVRKLKPIIIWQLLSTLSQGNYEE